MRTPIEAQRRYGGPWKPAELSDEGDDAPFVIMAGSDEPLEVAHMFASKVDAGSDPGLVEGGRAAGFMVVEESRLRASLEPQCQRGWSVPAANSLALRRARSAAEFLSCGPQPRA